jgi:amidase
LQVTAGVDPDDPVASRLPVGDYLVKLDSGKAPRIGLIRRFFMEEADPETQRHVGEAVEKLTRAGAVVEEVALPESFDTAIDDQRTIAAAEAAAFHRPMYEVQAQDYRPNLRETLRRGLEIDAVTYSRALERRLRFITDMQVMAEKSDVLLTPSTPTPALADLTNTGNSMFQGPWTSCGLPTISLPSGLAASGLPLGIQLIAGPFREESLLTAARWCEQVLNVSLSPPL